MARRVKALTPRLRGAAGHLLGVVGETGVAVRDLIVAELLHDLAEARLDVVEALDLAPMPSPTELVHVL